MEDKGLWLIADGVGGLSHGETASAIASQVIGSMVSRGEGVNQAIESAHKAIQSFGGEECNMAAALVLLLSRGGVYNVFWAGDSRAYLFDGQLTQLTRDHTHLQYLLDQKMISEAEAEAEADPRKNGITKAVGVNQLESVRADTMSGNWTPNQKLLLCSDGLSGYVTESEIVRVLESPMSEEQQINLLIELALDQGSTDNITVILVKAPTDISYEDDDTEIPNKSILARLNR